MANLRQLKLFFRLFDITITLTGIKFYLPLSTVPCAQGYYSSGDTITHYQSVEVNQYYPVWVPTCTPCSKGSYQQSIGATQCTSCPDRYTTTRYGATSESECEGMIYFRQKIIAHYNAENHIAKSTIHNFFILFFSSSVFTWDLF